MSRHDYEPKGREVEDGMGFSGLAPTAEERRNSVYEETRNKIARAREQQLAKAVAALRQIKTVCEDNAAVTDWGKAMALDFVRQVATAALD